MKLNSLSLEHFRNYSAVNIEKFGNVNILLGNNAQGKTNFFRSNLLISIR